MGLQRVFCFGRPDDTDGEKSNGLNCDPAFEENPDDKAIVSSGFPCKDNDPDLFGQDHQGLIYVNAQGPNGTTNPYLSALDIQRTFSRMGMSFRQTVALVGGGHAFGQTHALAGEARNVITSGFEGAWTTKPTTWDNEYFFSLIEEDWEPIETWRFNPKVKAVHGTEHPNKQWQTIDRESKFKGTMMTTADMGLKAHPDFSKHALDFKKSLSMLDVEFRSAWELLTTNGRGWVEVKRCVQLDDFM